jgi:hypothetical protein
MITLGHLAFSNVICLRFSPSMTTADGVSQELNSVNNSVNYCCGYLVEMSHGFTFLFLAPSFVVLGWLFLKHIAEAVKEFTEGVPQRLTGGTGSVSEAIRRANRRLFRPLVLLLPLGFVLGGAVEETSSYLANRNGKRDDLGYIQTPFLPEWKRDFETCPPVECLEKLPTPVLKDVLTSLGSAFHNTSATNLSNWRNCVKVLSAPPGPEQIQQALRYGEMDKNYTVDLRHAAANHLIQFGVKIQSPVPTGNRIYWHYAFAASVVLFEGLFHGFLAWIILKIGFWITLVYRWLPANDAQREHFVLRFNDKEFKYGLPELYAPYNLFTALLTTGALALALNWISNAEKHTSSLGTMDPQFVGQMIIVLAVSVAMGMLVFGPMFLFQLRLRATTRKYVSELREELKACASEHPVGTARDECIEKIEERIKTALGQRTWPKGDPVFKRLVLATSVLFLLPILLKLPVVPEKAEKAASAIQYAKEGVLRIACLAYGFDPH